MNIFFLLYFVGSIIMGVSIDKKNDKLEKEVAKCKMEQLHKMRTRLLK